MCEGAVIAALCSLPVSGVLSDFRSLYQSAADCVVFSSLCELPCTEDVFAGIPGDRQRKEKA